MYLLERNLENYTNLFPKPAPLRGQTEVAVAVCIPPQSRKYIYIYVSGRASSCCANSRGFIENVRNQILADMMLESDERFLFRGRQRVCFRLRFSLYLYHLDWKRKNSALT